MSSFHINPTTGEVDKCRALIKCRFGGEDLHFDTAADARKAYEIKLSREPWGSFSKTIDFPDPEEYWTQTNKELHRRLKKEFLEVRDSLVKKFSMVDPEKAELVFGSAEAQLYREYLSVSEYTHGNTQALNNSFTSTMLEYAREDLALYRPSGSEPEHNIESFVLKENFRNLEDLSVALDSFLANQGQNTGNKIVYRGMETIPSHWKLTPNEEVNFEGYLSTSLDPKIAKNYARAEFAQKGARENIVFELKTDNGAYVNGMNVADASTTPGESHDEREVLFGRNTTWIILGKRTVTIDGQTIEIYSLEEK